MIRKIGCRGLLITVLLTLALSPGAFAAERPPRPDKIEQFRRQLAAYFANLHESSPTVLAPSPPGQDTGEAMQKRIAAMSREELAELAEGFSQVPNWQIAPEALASTLPAATLAAGGGPGQGPARRRAAETFRRHGLRWLS
jgi:hypothetical protein